MNEELNGGDAEGLCFCLGYSLSLAVDLPVCMPLCRVLNVLILLCSNHVCNLIITKTKQ